MKSKLPLKSPKTTFLLLALVVFGLVLIALILVGWYVLGRQNNRANSQVLNVGKNKNWKIYKTNEYELKYPPQYGVNLTTDGLGHQSNVLTALSNRNVLLNWEINKKEEQVSLYDWSSKYMKTYFNRRLYF